MLDKEKINFKFEQWSAQYNPWNRVKDGTTAYQLEDIYGLPKETMIDQRAAELRSLIEIYKEIKPMRVLEIGSYYGGTLYYWLKFAQPGAQIIALDIDVGKLFQSVRKWDDIEHTQLDIIKGDSGSVDTFHQIWKLMPQIDFLFIDGYHFFPTPRTDYEWYGSLVKKGVIALHDINCGPAKDVNFLWNEIKRRTENTVEFIELPKGEGFSYGIGVEWRGTKEHS